MQQRQMKVMPKLAINDKKTHTAWQIQADAALLSIGVDAAWQKGRPTLRDAQRERPALDASIPAQRDELDALLQQLVDKYDTNNQGAYTSLMEMVTINEDEALLRKVTD